MGGPGSGPRKRKIEPNPALEAELGDWGEDAASHRAWCLRVARAVAGGRIAARDAETLLMAARNALGATRHVDERQRITHLEGMLAEAKRIQQEGLKREAEDRHHVHHGLHPHGTVRLEQQDGEHGPDHDDAGETDA